MTITIWIGQHGALSATGTMAEDTLHYCETTTGICKKSINGQNGFISVCNIWRRNGIPSQELLDCYVDGKNDRRFDLFYVEHGNRRFSVAYDWYRYNQLYDDAMPFRFDCAELV